MLDNVALWLGSQWGKRVAWIGMLVVSLLFLVTLVKLPFVWYADKQLVAFVPQETVDMALDNQAERVDFVGQIPGWHLFGIDPSGQQSASLPITSLRLSLVGIVTAFPENASSVIISEAGQQGQVYRIGDSLPVGVKVNAITKDGVILENAGRLEKLPLIRQLLVFQGMPKRLLQEG